jgi:PKD repeat protein
MKKYLTCILIVFSLGLIFTMCGKDDDSDTVINPVANFTITGGDKPAPHKVILTNTSTDATTYEWDFGDGAVSTITSPSHVYEEEGTYTISLKAKNGSLQNIRTKTITILPKPTQLKMTQLTLTGYPETNDTTGWDADSPADVFFTVTNYIGTVFFTSEVKNDLLPANLPSIYTVGFPYTFTSLTTVYVIRFYDYDDVSSFAYMGAYYFSMDLFAPDDGSDYPTEIEFDTSGSDLKFKLAVEWIN